MALSFPVRVSCAFAQIRWWVADSSSWRSDIFIAPNLCVRKDFYANTSISWYHYWIIHLYNLIQLSKSIQTHLGTANSNLQEHLLIPNFWTSIKAFFCGRNRCFTPSQCRRGLANVPRLVVRAVRAMQAMQVGRVPRVPRVLFAWELRVSRWPSCNASQCVGKDDVWGVLRLRWLPVTWRIFFMVFFFLFFFGKWVLWKGMQRQPTRKFSAHRYHYAWCQHFSEQERIVMWRAKKHN